jgi:hypothetical protein
VASSIPNALPAFMSIATAALPTGFLVREGSILGPYDPSQALLVTGVTITQDAYAELGPTYRHEERYNIMCYLVSSAGTDDQPSRLAEVYGLYVLLSEAVANNPNLNSTVRLGWCRQLGMDLGYDSKGLSVGTLRFQVECQARVTSLT